MALYKYLYLFYLVICALELFGQVQADVRDREEADFSAFLCSEGRQHAYKPAARHRHR